MTQEQESQPEKVIALSRWADRYTVQFTERLTDAWPDLARRIAVSDAWLPRTCAANSSLDTPVARVSSRAMSGESSWPR